MRTADCAKLKNAKLHNPTPKVNPDLVSRNVFRIRREKFHNGPINGNGDIDESIDSRLHRFWSAVRKFFKNFYKVSD